MTESTPSRRMSMTDGERVDIDGQFNPNIILKSFNTCFGSVTSLGVIREQLPKDLREENWNSFCDDVDLELSRLENIKCIYYPLSGLMLFLIASVVWVPIAFLRHAFFSVENGSFHLWYYLGWLGTILVPSIAYGAMRFHISAVSHLVWEEVRDVCVEKSVINVIRYELHEEQWGRCTFGSKYFIIVRNYAQNSKNVSVEYV